MIAGGRNNETWTTCGKGAADRFGVQGGICSTSRQSKRNREKIPVGTLLELIEAIDLALKKMVPNDHRPKLAYPQPATREELPHYDLGRWVDATRKMYGLMVQGYTQDQAKAAVLGNWERREKMDYEQWARWYKERGPEKYPKLASFDDALMLGGIPIGALQSRLPNAIQGGQGHAPKVSPGLPQYLPHSQNDTSDVRDRIEGQRKKLISRLNSAEKMLASMDGQLFAGDDQEVMLQLLQDLKRRIQTANKRTVKSSLFEDHIYRAANQLKVQGREKAAGFFYKLAQLPPPPGDMGGGGDMGDLPGMGDMSGAAGAPPEGLGGGDAKAETHDLLKEFFDNLKRGVSDPDDEPEERAAIEKAKHAPPPPAPPPPAPAAPAPAAPTPEPPAPPGAPGAATAAKLDTQIKLGMGVWQPLKSFAQAAPVPPPVPAAPAPAAPPPEAPVAAPAPTPEPEPEVVVEETEPEEPASTDNTDDVIEAALKNVSINDVISRLEMLVSIYNQREISRQLAILDIMMDRIGLASFFPALGEAMSKALEANQYIGSRLEGVLTKVKGSVDVPGTSEWVDAKPKEANPETENIRQRLEQQKKEEDRHKEQRKQQEIAKMEGRPAPSPAPAETQIGDAADLQRPSRVEKAPRLEVR